jgi:hypothetical protein
MSAVRRASTNGAIYPFWSPDSQSIGFYANGELKRISAEGGPIQSLCRASMVGNSASWGRTGTIIFCTGTGLACVSEDSGESMRKSPPGGPRCSSLGEGNRFMLRKRQNPERLAFSAALDRWYDRRRMCPSRINIAFWTRSTDESP